jgi:hypothetical protein
MGVGKRATRRGCPRAGCDGRHGPGRHSSVVPSGRAIPSRRIVRLSINRERIGDRRRCRADLTTWPLAASGIAAFVVLDPAQVSGGEAPELPERTFRTRIRSADPDRDSGSAPRPVRLRPSFRLVRNPSEPALGPTRSRPARLRPRSPARPPPVRPRRAGRPSSSPPWPTRSPPCSPSHPAPKTFPLPPPARSIRSC